MQRYDMAFPETVSEASELLAADTDSKLIAGGTAIGVVMKQGVFMPEKLINIRGLADDLQYIEKTDEGVEIGALSTLRDIERHEAISEHYPTIVECLDQIAGVRVRNTATIGGHLAHADIHLDLPPVLAGYGAEIVVTDGSEQRRMPLEEFMFGYYQTDLEDHELIESIILPDPPESLRGTYHKYRYFSEVDWPCVGVAAFVAGDPGSLTDVRVLLNSVSSQPIMRVDGIEDVHDGELTDDVIADIVDLVRDQAQPTDDLRGSADYKEQVAGVYTRRALEELGGNT